MTTTSVSTGNAPGLNKNPPPIVSGHGQIPAEGGNVGALETVLAELRALNARLDALFDKSQITADSILTIDQFAAHQQVTRRTIDRWIAAGMPTECKAPGHVRILYGKALAWLNRYKPKRR